MTSRRCERSTSGSAASTRGAVRVCGTASVRDAASMTRAAREKTCSAVLSPSSEHCRGAELRLFGEMGRDGDERRAPAGVGAYADVRRCCDEQLAEREGCQDALGARAPRLGRAHYA